MAYSLCLELGVIHPDILLDSLTVEQWNGWIDYFGREPWGQSREDLREEANRIRFCAMMFGGKDLPMVFYPYFEDESSKEDYLKSCLTFDKSIVPDGKGGYKWQVQPLPD